MSSVVGSSNIRDSRDDCRNLVSAYSTVVAVAPDPTPRTSFPFTADPTGGPKRTLPGRLNAL